MTEARSLRSAQRRIRIRITLKMNEARLKGAPFQYTDFRKWLLSAVPVHELQKDRGEDSEEQGEPEQDRPAVKKVLL